MNDNYEFKKDDDQQIHITASLADGEQAGLLIGRVLMLDTFCDFYVASWSLDVEYDSEEFPVGFSVDFLITVPAGVMSKVLNIVLDESTKIPIDKE